jgi:hypothetical protein
MFQGELIELVCPRRIPAGFAKLLLGSAMAFAIAALDGVREKSEAAASDRDDIVALFLQNFPDETHREMLMANVERVLGHAPDMVDWKDLARRDS